jgi:1-deoxy-D-xylulose-5-phosphate reductoisomerase
MENICILGATGSIGKSTIDVVLRHPDLFSVYALTANNSIDLLLKLADVCQPKYVVVSDSKQFKQAKASFADKLPHCEVLTGAEALEQVASASDVDVVMAAIVGAAGLLPTLAAVKAGKKVLLANKESLVMSGDLFIQSANKHNAQLFTVNR